ncbi:methyltransferase [Candidatus Woesearchaeota archaeon]|nr:methyltransferase [Candidatus Woesearchaeota archaeon]
MISACAITDKGIEKIALLELDEIIKVKGKAEDKVVLFECKDYDELMRFCYKSQSTQRAILLFSSFNFKNQEELISKIDDCLKKINLSDWLDKDKTLKVECERIGEHSFGSQTIEEDVGEKILAAAKKKIGFTPSVSMKGPDTIFYVFINHEKAYFGIDFVGRDLSKRNYRIYSAPAILNANLAYALVRLSSYDRKKKQKLIDVFCKSGVVCIEAALYATGLSINHYSKDFAFKKLKILTGKDWDDYFKKIDSEAKLEKLDITGSDQMLRNVEASKRNAKLAGVDKLINFSRIDVEWLDTKKDEKSIDLVVSRIACPSKHTAESEVRKLYKELFYQAEFFMKKGGRMAVITENTTLFKESITPDFKLVQEDDLWSGEQKFQFVMIEKR